MKSAVLCSTTVCHTASCYDATLHETDRGEETIISPIQGVSVASCGRGVRPQASSRVLRGEATQDEGRAPEFLDPGFLIVRTRLRGRAAEEAATCQAEDGTCPSDVIYPILQRYCEIEHVLSRSREPPQRFARGRSAHSRREALHGAESPCMIEEILDVKESSRIRRKS